MEINSPPYTITDKMLNLATTIMEKIGEANYFESLNRFPELRRKTRIKQLSANKKIFKKLKMHIKPMNKLIISIHIQ